MKRRLLPCYVSLKPCGCPVYAVGESPPADGQVWRLVPDGEEVKFKKCDHEETTE